MPVMVGITTITYDRYHTVKNFDNKDFGEFGKLQQFARFLK